VEISESQRVARDLHDGIAQDLIALGYSIDLILAVPDTSTDMRRDLRALRFKVDDLVSKVRREIFQLRTSSRKGIVSELNDLALHICAERIGTIALEEIVLTEEEHLLIVNIASELLRNSAFHSGGTQIDLSLNKIEDRILLEISDNGCGGAHISSTRFGLRGISERLESVHGNLCLTSDESGTRALVSL
jgi:NarL family two-component system sensor histidine kinase LiaS